MLQNEMNKASGTIKLQSSYCLLWNSGSLSNFAYEYKHFVSFTNTHTHMYAEYAVASYVGI
jgi:hypothetical protein